MLTLLFLSLGFLLLLALLFIFVVADGDLTLMSKKHEKREVIEGKVVCITGASRGIGEVLAKQLASLDAKLILSARNKSELDRVKSQLKGKYAPEDVKHVVEQAMTLFRGAGVDYLIHNAAYERPVRRMVEASKLKTRKRKRMAEVDLLSKLPEDLLVNILSRIPAKEAMATMILSKRWRSIWTNLPCLELDITHEFAIRLPKTLYTCKTLVKLKLCDKILLEDSAPASLPCLKTLELYSVRYKDEESIASFLSNCPVLEVLIVVRSDDDKVKKFMVKVSSLREFSYENMIAMAEEKDGALVMDTPSLKNFKLESWESGSSCKIQTKMTLDDAFIDIMDGCESPDDNFLKSMASLITLHMFLTYPMVPCCNTVKFSRLTECKIIPNYSDWLKPVMSLLANSPKLKKLSIQYERQDEDICWPDSWKEPNCIPECLSSCFEVFEWEQYGGTKVEKQFISYILGNSICLKTVIISILEFEDSTFGEEQMIMEDLKHIPRLSTTSHLLFK